MPTAPGYAECSIEMTLTGMNRPAYTTFGVDPTETDPNLIGAAIGGSLAAAGSFASRLDNAVVITGVRVSLGTDGGGDIVGWHPMALSGTGIFSPPPPNVAILVHKRTGRGGRRGRGRMYLPWYVSEADIDEMGKLTGATLTATQNAMNTWRSALASAQMPMVLLHNAGVTSPGPPDVVTTLQVDPMVGTQRRRLGR